MYEKALSDDERKCRQLFRLTNNDKDDSYEFYKSRVEDRLVGTCEWFLEQPHLGKWLENDKGLLIVSADPGCGKSVLAKHLIDDVLPESNPSATICYFFFKDIYQNTQKQAICALLHQLFTSKPALIKHARSEFDANGHNLINMPSKLWDIFSRVINDPDMGRTIFVLDALDECKESELTDLTDKVKSIQNRGETSARFFLTSRPYENIISEFRELIDDSPHIHIPGENESEKITREVNIVIKHRVGLLARKKHLNATVQSHLEERLLQMNHRTYLWIHLVFDYLESKSFEKVKRGIDDAFIDEDKIPVDVNDAYAKLLRKSDDIDMARKAFCIMLAATRPLTLTEMNVAIHLDLESDELELESDEDFQVSLRNWCGLLLSVKDKRVLFLHQTAREFLVQKNGFGLCSDSGPINIKEAQCVLAVSCIAYINTFMPRAKQTDSADPTSTDLNTAFSDYSSFNWNVHIRAAILEDDESVEPYLTRICDPKSGVYAAWYDISKTPPAKPAVGLGKRNTLWVAAYFGISSVVRRILQHEEIEDVRDEYHGLTIAHAAVSPSGNVEVIKLLAHCEKIQWDALNQHEEPPIFTAINSKQAAAVRCLIETGKVDVNYNTGCQTPLTWAVRNATDGIVKLLSHTEGIELNTRGDNGLTAFAMAVRWGFQPKVRTLLELEAVETNTVDWDGASPLSWAIWRQEKTMVKLLVDSGRVNLNQRDWNGDTALSFAKKYKSHEIVELLAKAGAVA